MKDPALVGNKIPQTAAYMDHDGGEDPGAGSVSGWP